MPTTENQGVFLTKTQLQAMILMMKRVRQELIDAVINTASSAEIFYEPTGDYNWEELKKVDPSIGKLTDTILILIRLRMVGLRKE